MSDHISEKKIIYIEKRPMTTPEDYNRMIIYIKEISKRAIADIDFRNELLHSTGMYDNEGHIKEEFV